MASFGFVLGDIMCGYCINAKFDTSSLKNNQVMALSSIVPSQISNFELLAQKMSLLISSSKVIVIFFVSKYFRFLSISSGGGGWDRLPRGAAYGLIFCHLWIDVLLPIPPVD